MIRLIEMMYHTFVAVMYNARTVTMHFLKNCPVSPIYSFLKQLVQLMAQTALVVLQLYWPVILYLKPLAQIF